MSVWLPTATLPNADLALKGQSADGERVYFVYSTASRDYNCRGCRRPITRRDPNVLVIWRDRIDRGGNLRCHMHFDCAWQLAADERITFIETCDESTISELKRWSKWFDWRP